MKFSVRLQLLSFIILFVFNLAACKQNVNDTISSNGQVSQVEGAQSNEGVPTENLFDDVPLEEEVVTIPDSPVEVAVPFLYQADLDPLPIPEHEPIPEFENPIVAKIYRLSGGSYEITAFQMREIERAEDPQKVADWLDQRVENFRELGARTLNIDVRHIGIQDVLGAINYRIAIHSYGSMSAKSYLQKLGFHKAYDLGKRVGREHRPKDPGEHFSFEHESQAGRLVPPPENTIVREISRLTDDQYILSHYQIHQVQRARDPLKVADLLKQRIMSFRSRGAQALGIDVRFLTDLYVLHAINLEFPVSSYGQISKTSYLQHLGSIKSFEVGYKKGLGVW